MSTPIGESIGTAEAIARAFHEAYEQLAPVFGYETRKASAKPWQDVPQQNRDLMTATVATLLGARVITAGQCIPMYREEPRP